MHFLQLRKLDLALLFSILLLTMQSHLYTTWKTAMTYGYTTFRQKLEKCNQKECIQRDNLSFLGRLKKLTKNGGLLVIWGHHQILLCQTPLLMMMEKLFKCTASNLSIIKMRHKSQFRTESKKLVIQQIQTIFWGQHQILN